MRKAAGVFVAADRAVLAQPLLPTKMVPLDPATIAQLRRIRTRSGYTAVRVTYATRKLLQMIELTTDEPLDSIIFYMAARKLQLDFAGLLAAIDHVVPRRGCAVAAAQ